jgi:DNA-nicking Smr family endonuclease
VGKKPFNNPFEALRGRDIGSFKEPEAKAEPKPEAPAMPPDSPVSEDALWQEAVRGAKPVKDDGHGRVTGRVPRVATVIDPELANADELKSIISGDAPFDIADTDEFIEGHVAGFDANVLRKLRRGDFAVQAHTDLHGLTRAEAKEQVERFLRASRERGLRCVLIIHGRGLHSKDQVPVLKEALRRWLQSARLARHVLAFATARPNDGGLGAIYVLLRKQGR